MEKLPDHLGGSEGETHIDEGVLDYLIREFNIKSMVDVGCGPGGMVQLARKKKLHAIGIDGDYLLPREIDVIIHDFTKGPYNLLYQYGLAWCVEFVEHVEPIYMRNFISVFKQCKYVCMTHAYPGQGGHHHVNERSTDFWIGAMTANGFTGLEEETRDIRIASTMEQNYIRNVGLLFRNDDL